MRNTAIFCIGIQSGLVQNHQKVQKSNLKPLTRDVLCRNEKGCNRTQSVDTNRVRVLRNSKKQSRPYYWCLFYKKYPASHCKQGCFLPLDLTGTISQATSTSALEVQPAAGIRPQPVQVTTYRSGLLTQSVGCFQPPVTSCPSPAVPLAQAGVKAGRPNHPGKDTPEEQHNANPSSLHSSHIFWKTRS